MKKEISYKLVALTFGVVVVCFAVAFYAMGFTEPTVNPPGGNVSLPLNTGNVGQSKEGGLILNTGGAEYGLIIQNGKVGINDSSPDYALDVVGDIKASGTVCDSNGCIGDGGSGGDGLVCETIRQALITEADNEKPEEAITIPTACRFGKPCYVILTTYQNNTVNNTIGYWYHQLPSAPYYSWSMNGVNVNKFGLYNGDSVDSIIATTSNITVRDDRNNVEELDYQWTFTDASLNFKGSVEVCHF